MRPKQCRLSLVKLMHSLMVMDDGDAMRGNLQGTFVCMYVHIDLYTYVCTYIYICMCIYIYTYMCICIHICVCTCVCVCAYVHACL